MQKMAFRKHADYQGNKSRAHTAGAPAQKATTDFNLQK